MLPRLFVRYIANEDLSHDCNYVARRPYSRCPMLGLVFGAEPTVAAYACPLACHHFNVKMAKKAEKAKEAELEPPP